MQIVQSLCCCCFRFVSSKRMGKDDEPRQIHINLFIYRSKSLFFCSPMHVMCVNGIGYICFLFCLSRETHTLSLSFYFQSHHSHHPSKQCNANIWCECANASSISYYLHSTHRQMYSLRKRSVTLRQETNNAKHTHYTCTSCQTRLQLIKFSKKKKKTHSIYSFIMQTMDRTSDTPYKTINLQWSQSAGKKVHYNSFFFGCVGSNTSGFFLTSSSVDRLLSMNNNNCQS